MKENIGRENIGRSIKRIRESRDMEQQELAKLIGVSNPIISQYERGKKLPSLTTAINMAAALRCSLDDLCGRTTSRNSR